MLLAAVNAMLRCVCVHVMALFPRARQAEAEAEDSYRRPHYIVPSIAALLPLIHGVTPAATAVQ